MKATKNQLEAARINQLVTLNDMNSCCNCIEGQVLGEKAYCNLDGRFHLARDELGCKHHKAFKQSRCQKN